MARPALASLEDLTARMATAPDPVRGQARLDDASRWIRGYTRLDFLDEEGNLLITDDQEIVITICCSVAERVLANPQGITSVGLGDWSESWGGASVDAYFTAQERRALDAVAGRTGLGSIPTERRSLPCDEETLWLPVSPPPPDGAVLPWL